MVLQVGSASKALPWCGWCGGIGGIGGAEVSQPARQLGGNISHIILQQAICSMKTTANNNIAVIAYIDPL